MIIRLALTISILTLSLSTTANETIIDTGYLGFKSNPVRVKFDSGKQGETPAGTKVDILIWSLSYTKDYVRDVMSGATKDETKTLRHSKEASACLSNPECKAILTKYDTEGLVMKSYEHKAKYGKSVENNNLVKLLDGPLKGKKAWAKDNDLYFKP